MEILVLNEFVLPWRRLPPPSVNHLRTQSINMLIILLSSTQTQTHIGILYKYLFNCAIRVTYQLLT